MMDKRELIICDGEVSRNAHRELFRPDGCVYLTVPSGHGPAEGCPGFFAAIEDFIELCNASSPDPFSAQFVLTWENLLRLCLWKSDRLLPGEILKLLEDAGMRADELDPLGKAGTGEIFRSLYYGKRFDILRRLCHAARSRIEDRLGDSKCDIVCHVVAEETKRIVASSL
jgi:hypothetical protein